MRRTAGPCAQYQDWRALRRSVADPGGIQQVYTHTFTSKAEMYPADKGQTRFRRLGRPRVEGQLNWPNGLSTLAEWSERFVFGPGPAT